MKTMVRPLVDAVEALRLERGVADRQHFIEQEDVWLEMSGNREAEANVHPRRVVLHRHVDELTHAGKVDDSFELFCDLRTSHAEDRAAQVDVFAAGQLRMKSRADLDEGRQLPSDGNFTRRRRGHVRKQLEDSALARSVVADDAERLTPLHLERDVTERPEFFSEAQTEPLERAAHRMPPGFGVDCLLDHVPLRDSSESEIDHGIFGFLADFLLSKRPRTRTRLQACTDTPSTKHAQPQPLSSLAGGAALGKSKAAAGSDEFQTSSCVLLLQTETKERDLLNPRRKISAAMRAADR
jgi:hypothetical protein